jgi:hypothetical protein
VRVEELKIGTYTRCVSLLDPFKRDTAVLTVFMMTDPKGRNIVIHCDRKESKENKISGRTRLIDRRLEDEDIHPHLDESGKGVKWQIR